MTELILVRHGETDWNLAKRIQGSTDIPLNETGREQASAAAERLATEHWDAIVTSPLGRALETARIIARRLGLGEPQVDGRLVERAYGEAEGMDAAALAERFPGMDGVPGIEKRSDVTRRVLPPSRASPSNIPASGYSSWPMAVSSVRSFDMSRRRRCLPGRSVFRTDPTTGSATSTERSCWRRSTASLSSRQFGEKLP